MNKYFKIVCLTLSMGVGFGLSNIAKADGHSVMFASWGGGFQDALRSTMLTPAAPGASGNIVTEDLVFLLEAMGLKTGIDFDRLIAARNVVATALPDVELYGFTPDAGLPLSSPLR